MPQNSNTPSNPTWVVPAVTEERQQIGPTQIVPVNASAVIGLTPPTGANLAEVQVDGNLVRFGFGIVPTSTVGKRMNDMATLEIESLDAINQFAAIAENGNAVLYIDYFNHKNRNA